VTDTLLEHLVKEQFNFALRNGAADFTINGKTVKALLVEAPVTESSSRRGRQRGTRRAIVGVLKKDIGILPVPGTPTKLDDWQCVVSEEGIEEEPFALRIFLRSP